MQLKITLTPDQLKQFRESWQESDDFWCLVETEVDEIVGKLSTMITVDDDGDVVLDVYDTPEGPSKDFKLKEILAPCANRTVDPGEREAVIHCLKEALKMWEITA